MSNLRERALSTRWGRMPWCDEATFLPITHASYRSPSGIELDLAAPIEEVQDIIAKALKPKRNLITAVRFGGGRIEEAFGTITDDRNSRPSLPEIPIEDYWGDVHPDRAATVAAPVIGCPMPAFVEAEVRSSFVLEQFLTPDQVEDYRRHGCFVSVGSDTGRRYMVIHRERPAMLAKYKGRQLFDLEANAPLCVHDWECPPPEEMLALHLCLQLPGKEHYIRLLPATWHTA